MNCVLKSFEVRKDGKTLSHFELFKNGFRNEVRTDTEVIHTGIYARQKYYECLETNKLLATLLGAEVVEIK